MKKSLLALAVLGAFAGAAQAQTNVTLYGIVDLGVRFTDNGTDDDNWTMENGQSASRFGIKGTEDLGSGLKASFVLENGFDADDGTSDLTDDGERTELFGRLAYVGLGGGFGQVRLGRQVSPIKAAVDTIDVFGGAGQNGIYDFVGTTAAGVDTDGDGVGEDVGFGIPERRSNQITFLAPKVAGFTGQVAYAFSEEEGAFAGTFDSPRAYGAQVGYGNGPVNVQVAYDNVRFGTDFNNKTAYLGATYDLGVAKIHAGYAAGELEFGAGEAEMRAFHLGATAKLGVGSLQAQWIRNDARDVADGETDTLQLGYSHPISKRTNLYAMAAHIRNDDGASIGLGTEEDAATGAEVPVVGENANIVTVGVRHKF